MCAVSFALGRWRGEHGRIMGVPLNPAICLDSYADGYNAGLSTRRARREAAPRHAGRR